MDAPFLEFVTRTDKNSVHRVRDQHLAGTGLDHVALASTDANTTAALFRDVLGLAPGAAHDASAQPLRLVRVPAGNATLDIAQPLSPEHRIARHVAERGPGMFAIGILFGIKLFMVGLIMATGGTALRSLAKGA